MFEALSEAHTHAMEHINGLTPEHGKLWHLMEAMMLYLGVMVVALTVYAVTQVTRLWQRIAMDPTAA